MESHLQEWFHLLLRWIHFIVGVAWIGASFYFNWLENHLQRNAPQEPGIAGDLWAIHGGGFYHLKKYKTAPRELPSELHWFKWEAYATWLSGFCLLAVVYYFNAQAFLLTPPETQAAHNEFTIAAVRALFQRNPSIAIVFAIAAVIGAWFVYDGLCRSRLQRAPGWLAACVFVALVLLTWLLCQVFSGRAAYIHVGAALGTMMVGNVFFVIIPAQKEMVAAVAEQRQIDVQHGANGLLRSRHNNYLTLPVLFIMLSSHFPGAYSHAWNWAILAGLAVVGWLVRHYFNVRKQRSPTAFALLPLALLLMVGLAWLSAPRPQPNPQPQIAAENAATPPPDLARIAQIIQQRCVGCHAAAPTEFGFTAPPGGLTLETRASIAQHASRIFTATVVHKTMPIGNLTGMSDAERSVIAAWYQALTIQKGGNAQ